MEMEEKIRQLLGNVNEEINDVLADENLLTKGLIDSFDIVALVVELEETFSIQLEADEIIEENFSSIQNIQALIERKIS